MIGPDKNLRLSFLNLDPNYFSLKKPFKNQDFFNKKSSLSSRKPKIDRQIFTALSTKLRKSRQENIKKNKLFTDDQLKSSQSQNSLFFIRNFSVATLQINGTCLLSDQHEKNLIKSEKTCDLSPQLIEKKSFLKRPKKSLSNFQLKIPKNNSKRLTAKNSIDVNQELLMNPPSTSQVVFRPPRELLNLKEITIKSRINNQIFTRTDRTHIKVEVDDLSGWES